MVCRWRQTGRGVWSPRIRRWRRGSLFGLRCGLSVYIRVDFLFIPLLQAIVLASGLFPVSSLVHAV